MKAPRILGISALIGGLLRLMEEYLPMVLDARGLQVSYALTDATLILGLLGFYLALRDRLGPLGIFGILLAIAGLSAIRVGALMEWHIYEIGAALALFGTAGLGLDMLLKKVPSRIAAVLWLAALVLGLCALVPQMASPAALAAGIAFALGFMIEGAVLLF